ncbi:MAG: hypothetical protein AB8G22_09175 [Saprospiraceae bacterium]
MDEKEIETFTLVKQEVLENGEVVIVNEVPTNEGNLEIRLFVNSDQQKSSFTIVKDWRNKIDFTTTVSTVKMNQPIDEKGIVQIELHYQGKQINGERTVQFRNEFYFVNE